MLGGRDRPAGPVLGLLGRCEIARAFEQLSGSVPTASGPGEDGGVLEDVGDLFVRIGAGSGQVTGAGDGVVHQPSELPVHGAPLSREGGGRHGAGQERMREADPLAVDLDHARADQLIERRRGIGSEERLGQTGRRIGRKGRAERRRLGRR